MTDDTDPVAEMEDVPFTESEFKTAMFVLEAIRDDVLPDNDIGNRRATNQAHYTLQNVYDRLPENWSHEHGSCDIPDCNQPVKNFLEPFPVPKQVFVEAFTDDVTEDSDLVMCDHHHVAARIIAYTRPEPPYVDVGLYQEVTYYSRALAAETFDIPSPEMVTAPQNAEDDE